MIYLDTFGLIFGILSFFVLILVYFADRNSAVVPGFKYYRHTVKDIGRGGVQGFGMGLCISLFYNGWTLLCYFLWSTDSCVPNKWQFIGTLVLAVYYSLSINLRFFLVNSCNDVQIGEHYYVGVVLGMVTSAAPFLGVGLTLLVLTIFLVLIIPLLIVIPYIITLPVIGPSWVMITSLGSNITYLLLEENLFGHWTS